MRLRTAEEIRQMFEDFGLGTEEERSGFEQFDYTLGDGENMERRTRLSFSTEEKDSDRKE